MENSDPQIANSEAIARRILAGEPAEVLMDSIYQLAQDYVYLCSGLDQIVKWKSFEDCPSYAKLLRDAVDKGVKDS